MVAWWWAELANKFPSVQLDAFIVMPNHVHGITGLSLAQESDGRPHRGAPTLGEVVGWFKAMTTNAYIKGVKQQGWTPFPGRLWQRRYYDHIVRDEPDLGRIREYITGNPGKWHEDEENPQRHRHML